MQPTAQATPNRAALEGLMSRLRRDSEPAPALTDGAARRARRVNVLLVGVVLLSLADLIITLAYLRTTGMFEANPVAVFVIEQTGSSWAVAAFKAMSVALCVMILFHLRHRLTGELASWFSFGVLVFIAVQWDGYAQVFEQAEMMMLLGQADQLAGDQLLTLH